MKVGDKVQLETGESEVTRRVYDQLLKKTVFYAGEIRLTGNEKPVEEENIIIKKLSAVEEAIKAIPKVEIPEYPKFPEQKEFPAFPEFPKSMIVNVPDLSSIEKKLDTIIEKEDNETKELIKNALEELKKTKSDSGVVSAINKLAGIIPKNEDYTDILKEISKKLNPIVQEELRINKEQWKQLTKALSSIGGFGGGPGAVQLRSENGTILNPATEEKQDTIVTALGESAITATSLDASSSGDNTIVSITNTPKLYYICLSANGANSADVTAIVKIGATTKYKVSLKAGADWDYASNTDGRLISPEISTPNALKYYRVFANEVRYLGSSALGKPTEPYRIYARTANIQT